MRKVRPDRVAVEQDEMSFKLTDGTTVTLETGWQWVNAAGRNNREVSACGNGSLVGSTSRVYFEIPDERIVFRFGDPLEDEPDA